LILIPARAPSRRPLRFRKRFRRARRSATLENRWPPLWVALCASGGAAYALPLSAKRLHCRRMFVVTRL